MLGSICSSNQYIVRYANGTLDTMFCSDRRLTRRIATMGSLHGAETNDLVRVPTLLDLDLQANKLMLTGMSQN